MLLEVYQTDKRLKGFELKADIAENNVMREFVNVSINTTGICILAFIATVCLCCSVCLIKMGITLCAIFGIALSSVFLLRVIIATYKYFKTSYDLDIGRIFAMQCSMHTFTTLPSNWYSIELYIPTIMKTVTVLARGKANVFCELIHLSSSWKLVKVGYKYFLYRSNEVI